jgi:hypothetical protein
MAAAAARRIPARRLPARLLPSALAVSLALSGSAAFGLWSASAFTPGNIARSGVEESSTDPGEHHTGWQPEVVLPPRLETPQPPETTLFDVLSDLAGEPVGDGDEVEAPGDSGQEPPGPGELAQPPAGEQPAPVLPVPADDLAADLVAHLEPATGLLDVRLEDLVEVVCLPPLGEPLSVAGVPGLPGHDDGIDGAQEACHDPEQLEPTPLDEPTSAVGALAPRR